MSDHANSNDHPLPDGAVFRNRRGDEWVAISARITSMELSPFAVSTYLHVVVLAKFPSLSEDTSDHVEDVARMGCMPKEQAERALAELENRKVISREIDSNGSHMLYLMAEQNWR